MGVLDFLHKKKAASAKEEKPAAGKEEVAAEDKKKEVQPNAGSFPADSQREQVKQELIRSGLADGELSKAPLVKPGENTADVECAVVLRRGRDILIFAPRLKGADPDALGKMLLRVNAMDGIHSGLPEELQVDLYKLQAVSEPGKNHAIWVEDRFKQRGVTLEGGLQAALSGKLEALPRCSDYESAQAHPYGVASFAGVVGGVYAYVNLGSQRIVPEEKMVGEKFLKLLLKIMNRVVKDEPVNLIYEAVQDNALFNTPLYQGKSEEAIEDAEDGGESGKVQLFRKLMPGLFVREDIRAALKAELHAEQQAQRQAKDKQNGEPPRQSKP